MASSAALIRSATPADVPAVLPMVRAICDLHERRDPDRFPFLPDVLDRYAAWLPERAVDPQSVFLVAENPSAPPALAAFAICTIEPEIPIFRIDRTGWIHDLFVIPEARRLGLARALLREISARFTSLGVAQIRLDTAIFNDDARALFAAEGFRPSVIEMLKPLRPLHP